MASRSDGGQMVALMRRVIRRAPLRLDVTMDVPLLVVRGSRDRVCSQDWCERLVASTTRSRPQVVDGSAHAIAYAAPHGLVALLRDEVLAGVDHLPGDVVAGSTAADVYG